MLLCSEPPHQLTSNCLACFPLGYSSPAVVSIQTMNQTKRFCDQGFWIDYHLLCSLYSVVFPLKGGFPPPIRMNFRTTPKQPLTPSPRFWELQ